VAAVSLILTAALMQSFGSIAVFLPIFIVVTIIFIAIGFPLYLLARRFRWENIRTAVAAGAVTGAAMPLAAVANEGSRAAWLNLAGYTLLGAIGGLIFFLAATASRNPPRNIAFLIAITGFSLALAPPASALLD
jgi:hypothetical protein